MRVLITVFLCFPPLLHSPLCSLFCFRISLWQHYACWNAFMNFAKNISDWAGFRESILSISYFLIYFWNYQHIMWWKYGKDLTFCCALFLSRSWHRHHCCGSCARHGWSSGWIGCSHLQVSIRNSSLLCPNTWIQCKIMSSDCPHLYYVQWTYFYRFF